MKSGENHRSIKEWMQIFSELYSGVDSKRTSEQMWIAVMAHSSSIGESIRKVSFAELLKSAAHTFCWLCGFVNHCNTRKDDVFSFTELLCEMVSLKYPLVCGHCMQKPCGCFPPEIDKVRDKAAQYGKLLEQRKGVLKSVRAYSIDDWKKAFRDIYGGQVHILTLDSIGFHFLEEVGEGVLAVRKLGQLRSIVDKGIPGIDLSFLNELRTAGRIVRQYKEYYQPERGIDYTSLDTDMLKWRIIDAKIVMIIEIADTFSWFCSIMNKLDDIAAHSGFTLPSLEEKLNQEYFDDQGNARCPTCGNKPCSCVFFA